LLSARSIEHVQRELADVQKKLERAANLDERTDIARLFDDCPGVASEYLAKLSNGDLVQLILGDNGLEACVTDRSGETFPVELLAAAHRDQVYLSMCLALLHLASRQGIWLPLVLDEPFERLDAASAASLGAVLENFCRHGHQVLVFTGQRAAAERLKAHGATVHDILNLRGRQPRFMSTTPTAASAASAASMGAKRRPVKRRKSIERSAKPRPANGEPPKNKLNNHSDAA
jgi:hypothetical protein